MGTIRPCKKDDIPLIADLYQATFYQNRTNEAQALQAYFTSVYFENPWVDDRLPSLVYQEEHGTITGFAGVMPRQMTLGVRTVLTAIISQVMVKPGSRTSMAGIQLVKAFLAGPQELSLVDGATDGFRKLFESLGGITALLYSFEWTQVLDAPQRPPAGAAEPLTDTAFNTCLLEDAKRHHLRPQYDERALIWLLQLMASTTPRIQLRKCLVRDAAQAPLGWYLYGVNPDGSGEVLHITANSHAVGDVLDHLFYDAGQQGVGTLHGRISPRLRQGLTEKSCRFHRGHWVLAASQTPELLHAIQHGETFLTRLDGDWCLRAP